MRCPRLRCPSTRTTGMRCRLRNRHDGPCVSGHGWNRCEWIADARWGQGYRTHTPARGTDCWWTIHGEELAAALNRASAGEHPDLVYAELYANTDPAH